MEYTTLYLTESKKKMKSLKSIVVIIYKLELIFSNLYHLKLSIVWYRIKLLEFLSQNIKPKLAVLTEKKIAQCESCELNFIWGKMRTAVQETASRQLWRNCAPKSKMEVMKATYVWFWRMGTCS